MQLGVYACVCVSVLYEEEDVGCEERVFEAQLRACELRVGRLAVQVLIVEGSPVEDAGHVAVELLQRSLRAVLQISTHGGQREDKEVEGKSGEPRGRGREVEEGEEGEGRGERSREWG